MKMKQNKQTNLDHTEIYVVCIFIVAIKIVSVLGQW